MKAPPELIARVESLEIDFTEKAFAAALEKGYTRADVPEVYRTADFYKKTIDSREEADYVHAASGRDLRGKPAYTAGKELKDEQGPYWYVITIHEAKKSVS